jgi:polyisoprenoid-binding protein YceI
MTRPLLCLLVLAFALDAQGAGVDYAKSEIGFVSRQMNVPVDGNFSRFSANIQFDPAKLSSARAEIEVELASVDTGSTDADVEVKKKGWFNSAEFPKARFVSSTVKQLGPDRYEARGKLSIKGIAHDVVAPFTVKPTATGRVFEGTFPILRLKFKIGEGIWSDTETVADEVQVRFRIVETRDAR